MSMGQVYLDLIRSGNILFKHWSAVIHCDKYSKNTIEVNFGIDRTKQSIRGERRCEANTVDAINKTVRFLKSCYAEWIAHVDEKRATFAELNHYRIEQVVVLRTELARFIRNSQSAVASIRYHASNATNRTLFDLLYNVNREVSVELLRQANDYACDKNDTPSVNTTVDANESAESHRHQEVSLYYNSLHFESSKNQKNKSNLINKNVCYHLHRRMTKVRRQAKRRTKKLPET